MKHGAFLTWKYSVIALAFAVGNTGCESDLPQSTSASVEETKGDPTTASSALIDGIPVGTYRIDESSKSNLGNLELLVLKKDGTFHAAAYGEIVDGRYSYTKCGLIKTNKVCIKLQLPANTSNNILMGYYAFTYKSNQLTMQLPPLYKDSFLMERAAEDFWCNEPEDCIQQDMPAPNPPEELSCQDNACLIFNPTITPDPRVIDIRADTNRNGIVEFDNDSEDTSEDTWDQSHGAVFLANIDDDELKCPKTGDDVDLPKCNDAANEVVDGIDDLLDMAPLQIKAWPDVPNDTMGWIDVSDPGANFVRLFKKQNDGTYKVYQPRKDKLTTAELKAGVEFRLEGKDIIRDKNVWDGYVNVTYRAILDGTVIGKDRVRLRISPIMTSHHLLPVETAYVTKIATTESQLFRADFAKAAMAAQVPNGVDEMTVPGNDQWTQDFFETGYMSMPGVNGQQHTIRIFYRAAVLRSYDKKNPLRTAGKVVFTYFRGKDAAGVQEYDLTHDGSMVSADSYGNLETIPPYTKDGINYPLGRLFRGSVSDFYPDPNMTKLLESQGMQPPVYIDTAWLLVGHVDETISFAKANTPRGWVMLANDARLAKTMLEEQVAKGNGNVKLFTGKTRRVVVNGKWVEVDAEISIKELLEDPDIMDASARSAVKVDAQLEALKEEIGVTDDEIVYVPFLHEEIQGYSIAYQPGTVNSTYLSDTHFAVPETHGPIINGKDIFKVQLETVLQPLGIKVAWVEDWDLYHVLEGEVHCGSNSLRKIPDVKWWETGR